MVSKSQIVDRQGKVRERHDPGEIEIEEIQIDDQMIIECEQITHVIMIRHEKKLVVILDPIVYHVIVLTMTHLMVVLHRNNLLDKAPNPKSPIVKIEIERVETIRTKKTLSPERRMLVL